MLSCLPYRPMHGESSGLTKGVHNGEVTLLVR